MDLLKISAIEKSFTGPDGSRHPVIGISDFHIGPKQQIAIRGESGSGKTTFLNLIAGILTPDSGSIRIEGAEMSGLSESRRDRLRADTLGYIFQTFNLLQGYSCLENVLMGMAFGGRPDRSRAVDLLKRVGLGDRLHHRPRQLSTGQQQRVAVARALANAPKLVLADEPTGNLDRRNAEDSLALIRESCRDSGAALLLVSHDPAVLAGFESVIPFDQINRCARPSVPGPAGTGDRS